MNAYLIPINGRWLSLTDEQFEAAIEQGDKLMPNPLNNRGPKQTCERLYTADQMEEITQVPASWFQQAARENRIPHIKLGRYTRFNLSSITKILESRR